MGKSYNAKFYFRPPLYIEPKDKEVMVIESGHFSDSEWEVLTSFHNEAESLFASKRLGNLKTSLSVNVHYLNGITDNSQLPDDDDTYNLLHRLRPFLLQQEPFYLDKIYNILRKHFREDHSNNALIAIKDLYSGAYFQSIVQIKLGNKLINCEKLLKTWLNAFHYHRDSDKRILFSEIYETIPDTLTKAIFVHMLFDKAKAIKHLNGIVTILGVS